MVEEVPDEGAVCQWCHKPHTPPEGKPASVCARCYQLLSRAGVSDDEIYCDMDENLNSEKDLNKVA